MIKFKGRLLLFNSENAIGRKIPKDCNIEFPKAVPAFYNYDMWNPMGVIGSASISKDDQGLLCDLSILDKYKDVFTEVKYFVGGYYQNVHMRSEAGAPVFVSGTLTAMSIIPDGAQLDDNLFVRKVEDNA